MKTVVLSLLLLLIFMPRVCNGIDPVAEYKNFSNLTKKDTLFRWSISFDGNNVIFLSTMQDYKDERHDGAVPSWTTYLSTGNGSVYSKLKGLIDSKGIADVSDIAIDPERMFIGQITQLVKKGIVTSQIDRPRKGGAVAYVYAYTLEGTYMRQTLLAKYDPDKGNAIYDQYLTDAKRTKVQLEEVSP